jgi:hypothetical protein
MPQKDCPHCGGLHFGQRFDDCPYLNSLPSIKEKVMISPTIGRVVWFRAGGVPTDRQALAALVCYVHSDTCVNLAIFDENGVASHKTSCTLYQGDGDVPTGDYCEWMPYQHGQAKKTEDAEKRLSETLS